MKHLIQAEHGLVWWANEEEEEKVWEKGLTGASATLLMYPELQAALPTPTEHKTKRERGWKRLTDRSLVCLVTSTALSGNCLSCSHGRKHLSCFTWSWVSACSHTQLPIRTAKPAVMTLMINTMCNPLHHTQSFSHKRAPICPDEVAANKHARSRLHSPAITTDHF